MNELSDSERNQIPDLGIIESFLEAFGNLENGLGDRNLYEKLIGTEAVFRDWIRQKTWNYLALNKAAIP